MQLSIAQNLSKRLHIDYSDGTIAPNRLLDLNKMTWGREVIVDLHLMVHQPAQYITEILQLSPHMVIIHAESKGNYEDFATIMHNNKIKVGVALMPSTPSTVITASSKNIDHVLIFSGNLGSFGGNANLSLISKIVQLRDIMHPLEIGWDGGVNDQNIRLLTDSGVDVLTVGGYIQKSINPTQAYATLKAIAVKSNAT
ncbi:MAG: ribulose-phosphate 3-epimerase [Candidatus Saccharimonadales bacterium]